jgi:hypothetical protein
MPGQYARSLSARYFKITPMELKVYVKPIAHHTAKEIAKIVELRTKRLYWLGTAGDIPDLSPRIARDLYMRVRIMDGVPRLHSISGA